MLLSIVVSSYAYAQNQPVVTDNIRITRNGVVYSISVNETLSSISQKFTGQVVHWRAIGKSNQIENDRTIPIGKKILIPAVLLLPVPSFAKVEHCSGKNVIHSKAGDTEAKVGTIVTEGDVVETLDNGFISLILDDGTVFTLPPNSIVNLKTLRRTPYINSPRTELFLKKGRVSSQVTPFTSPDSRFEVQSPLAVSSVRGTNFRVSYDHNRVFNEVIEGKVAVIANNSGAAKNAGQLVTNGFGAVASNGRVSKPIALLAPPKVTDGYQIQKRLPIHFELSHPSATSFRVLISTDSSGVNNIAEAIVDSVDGKATAKLKSLEDGQYFVRYSAIDALGLEGLPGNLDFRVDAHPLPPFLLNPGEKFQGNTQEEKVNVLMQWSQVLGASAYRLQIAKDATFTDKVIDQSTEQDVGQYLVSLPAGSYYWRVATIIKNGQASKQGSFGDAKKVEVMPEQGAPVVKVEEGTVHFTWRVTKNQHFTFQVASSPSFNKILETVETAKSEATISALQADTYYARVRSTDDDGFVGVFSQAQKFVVPAHWVTGYGGTLQALGQPVGTGF